MGYDVYLSVLATVDLSSIFSYNKKYQQEQNYYNAEEWRRIKQDYLGIVSRDDYLRTVKVTIDKHGVLSLYEYRFPETVPAIVHRYALLLWLEAADPAKDVTICERYSFFDLYIPLHVNSSTVTFSVFFRSSYKGIDEVDIDYAYVAQKIQALKDKFGQIEIHNILSST